MLLNNGEFEQSVLEDRFELCLRRKKGGWWKLCLIKCEGDSCLEDTLNENFKNVPCGSYLMKLQTVFHNYFKRIGFFLMIIFEICDIRRNLQSIHDRDV